MVQTKIMHDCHRSSKMVQQLVFIILSKVKLMFEILDSQSPKFQSREICTDFQTSLLITSGTCLFLSKGMRLRFQKCTQMCLFWYLVATPNTLQIPSLYYHFSQNDSRRLTAKPGAADKKQTSAFSTLPQHFIRKFLHKCCCNI